MNTGAEDLKNVVITDPMFNDTVRVLKPTAGPTALGSVLIEGVDYILDTDDGTITLLGDLRQGERVFIRYTVVPDATGDIDNRATVEGDRTITMGDPVTDTDDKTVEVTRLVSQLEVSKYVTAYSTGLDLESEAIVWSESISFTSSGNRAAFKVTIRNTREGVLYVSGIADVFAAASMENATFYYNNGSGLEAYAGLEALLDDLRGIALYNGDGEIVFYFITDALNTRGTFTNTVSVTANDTYQERHDGSDSASVTVSWNDPTPYYPPTSNPPTTNPPPEEILPTEPPPLIDLPPTTNPPPIDDVIDDEIFDDEPPPLSQLPRTGVDDMVKIWFYGMCVSMLALGGVLRLINRDSTTAKRKRK